MKEQRAEYLFIPRRASAAAQTTEQPVMRRREPPAPSRHQVGHWAGLHPEDQPQQTCPPRAMSYDDWDENDEDSDIGEEEGRAALPTTRLRPSAIRRDVAPSRTGRYLPTSQYQERPHRPHWLLRLGLALSLLLLSWLLLTEAATWTQHTLDTLHYGYPRTYQTDTVVGHGDSPMHPSHFIALNLDGHLEVIELAGGTPAHAHIYVGPMLTGTEAAQAPVTIAFQDVNGDGKPDLLLFFNGIQVVYLNTGTSFQPIHP
jgi:hypothetical protein